MTVNQQIRLASRPQGMPSAEQFQYVDIPMPEPADGQAIVRTLYLSVDPYMRGRMNETKSYVPPFRVGEAMAGGIVAIVESSRVSGLAPGDIVVGSLPWQRYASVRPEEVRQVDPSLAPITTALGVLGMTGLTAYFGLFDIGKPQAGETVVVSGAAGAVGMIVGQLAKLHGCRAVGIAGSEAKLRYLTEELGFDAAVSYKSGQLPEQLEAACPDGVDVYFDNVGGEVSDAVLRLLNRGARIPVCGQIALYNLEQPDIGPRPQTQLVINTALMKGFLVGDYASRFPEGIARLAEWVRSEKLQYAETIVEGFERVPEAFLGLFRGENLGKQLVKAAEL
ncbi:putative NADP-dependent oxidoreductase YfmJ [Paenibacillus sp. J31TS4]|uniref:NADP-dependent oxidoreductase n=1 Tax=Paenibacillus sp. J31TS4 TaxID=2807195 RepID=UPI001B02DDB9|nr:NADP-dependent oxidoreductase [Paenibacillus sp. J31TS4]GIP39374.1 putative NADP-dependent oxidoreductase YfmJ [Paenibacillus sp. J31TS4]